MTYINQISQATEPESIHAFDIWVAHLPTQKDSHVQYGNRPVVVVSNDHINNTGPLVTVVPLTSQLKKTAMPSHVYLSSHIGGQKQLTCDSIALCDHVQTVDKRQLTWYIGSVSGAFERMVIQHALAVHLNMAA